MHQSPHSFNENILIHFWKWSCHAPKRGDKNKLGPGICSVWIFVIHPVLKTQQCQAKSEETQGNLINVEGQTL